MADVSTLRVPASQCTKGLVLRVTGRRAFAIRCWFAVKVFKLGAMILGTEVEIELSAPGDPRRSGRA